MLAHRLTVLMSPGRLLKIQNVKLFLRYTDSESVSFFFFLASFLSNLHICSSLRNTNLKKKMFEINKCDRNPYSFFCDKTYIIFQGDKCSYFIIAM